MTWTDDRSAGWRQFATRRESVSWVRLRRFIDAMPGAALIDLACDRMNESALIFVYEKHRFGIDLHEGSFRFTVEDPNCPDETLDALMTRMDTFVGR